MDPLETRKARNRNYMERPQTGMATTPNSHQQDWVQMIQARIMQKNQTERQSPLYFQHVHIFLESYLYLSTL